MAFATRLDDECTGHDACPSVTLKTASQNVIVNGKGVGRKTDTYNSHGCIAHATHDDVIVGGSGTVFANGLPIARIGDEVSIGGAVMKGSGNVKVGD